jgi:biotin operon repressor
MTFNIFSLVRIGERPGIGLGVSAKSVWRAIRAMKEVGLLVREGGDKGDRWIVKK